ncbi:MAG: DoxX family protein [Acidimicrobiales bacterium]|nr:DoxX family protein [Acidimicrobiales bacterium]
MITSATITAVTDYAGQLDDIKLLIRIFLGFTLAFHGYWKFFQGGKIEGTAGWFDSMGMKPNGKVHAILAASTELVCGILMALGFLTPLAAAGYVSLMIVAGWTVHRANGYRSGIDGWEYNSVLATFAVYVAATSPGAHSIDHALELDFAFKPYTAFAIAVVVGVAGAVGLLAACYRPPAKDEAKG